MIAAADIERARDVQIDEEVARRGIKLRRVGAEKVGPCPHCGGRQIMSGVLGINPGISGALALYRGNEWMLLDVPIVGDAKRHEINGPALCSWLREHCPDHAFIEYAAARPGQGVTSMFRFGTTYGGIKMALTACGVPYTVITPAKWKPGVGIQAGADKEASRLRALQLFPDQAASLARKKGHARADSMLIAYFGMRCAS